MGFCFPDGSELLTCLEEGASAAEQAALTTKINAGYSWNLG